MTKPVANCLGRKPECLLKDYQLLLALPTTTVFHSEHICFEKLPVTSLLRPQLALLCLRSRVKITFQSAFTSFHFSPRVKPNLGFAILDPVRLSKCMLLRLCIGTHSRVLTYTYLMGTEVNSN